MHADRDVRRFLRAGGQRLAAARFLQESGDSFHLDAIYLAGYSVECCLKGLILAATPASKRLNTLGRLSKGSRGHDFDYLAHLLDKRGVRFTVTVVANIRVLSCWGVRLRYEAGLVESSVAARFLDAAEQVCEWAKRSME